EIRDRLPDERRGIDTEQFTSGRVREQNRVRVDQRDLGQRVRKRDEQACIRIGTRLGDGGRRTFVVEVEPAVDARCDVDERAQPSVDRYSYATVLPPRDEGVQVLPEP